MRHARARDRTEMAIFNALMDAHASPLRGTDVDIYAVSRADMQGVLIEVKTPQTRNRLRPIQIELRKRFGSRYVVVTSVQEALQAVGVA